MKVEEVVEVAAGGEAAALEPAGSKTTAWRSGEKRQVNGAL